MSIGVLQYNWKITATIRKARRRGAISAHEADYLNAMATAGSAASSTTALVNGKGAPDFLYAGLYFSTLLWQSGDATGCDAKAKAGYKLAQFLLSQEAPAPDSYWAAKLLRELYDAHEESAQNAIASVA